MPTVRIGLSGWRYADWRGPFYPAGLAQRRELEHVAARFPTVELNGSFYALQRPASYLRWREQTPDGFIFAVKGPRFITHMKRLRDVRTPLAPFLALLPRSTADAARLATEHGDTLRAPAWTDVDADRPLRHALEARHASF